MGWFFDSEEEKKYEIEEDNRWKSLYKEAFDSLSIQEKIIFNTYSKLDTKDIDNKQIDNKGLLYLYNQKELTFEEFCRVRSLVSSTAVMLVAIRQFLDKRTKKLEEHNKFEENLDCTIDFILNPRI